MIQVVGHMSEVGLCGFECGDNFESLLDIEVGGVFFIAQRVKDKVKATIQAMGAEK